MKIPTEIPGVSVQAGGGGGVGGVLAIGAGAFLILLAYTGKLQEVWTAAFGAPLAAANYLWNGPNTSTPSSTGSTVIVGKQPNVKSGNCKAYTINETESVGPTCSDQNCPSGMIRVCDDTNSVACTTSVKLDAAMKNGWQVCQIGAGQAFTHVTMLPTGGWQRRLSGGAEFSPA